MQKNKLSKLEIEILKLKGYKKALLKLTLKYEKSKDKKLLSIIKNLNKKILDCYKNYPELIITQKEI